MKRLVYSPRAFIFIRSSTTNGRIYDVSHDITRGSVTQNIGDVCNAEFYLRNRYKKYLRDKDTGRPMFLPMDLVTIWLQRLPGLPIQEFTGYLDAVPYYQGYPGDAPFSATCTLKKLAYTWFDPGLAFFQNWLVANGWGFDPTTGQAFNTALNWDTQQTTKQNPLGASLNDGSFGKLLGRFMIDVAGWNAGDVLISDLPKQLPQAASKLYKTIATEANQSLSALSDFFGASMGTSVDLSGNKTDSATLQLKDTMSGVADDTGAPLIVLAWAAQVMSRMQPDYDKDSSKGASYGYGLYALRPANTPSGTPSAPGFADFTDSTTSIDGYTIDQILKPEVSCRVMAQRLIKQANGLENLVSHQSDLQALKNYLKGAIGRDLPTVSLVDAYSTAQKFVGASAANEHITQGNMPYIDPNSMSWSKLQTLNIMSDQEKALIRNYYQSKQDWLAALVYRVKFYDNSLRLAKPPAPVAGRGGTPGIALSNYQVFFNGPDSSLSSAFTAFATDTTIDQINLYAGSGGPWWSDSVARANQGHVSIFDNTPVADEAGDGMVFEQKTKPKASTTQPVNSGNAGADGGGTGAQGDPTVSWSQMASFTASSGFAANFAFPTDIIESTLLTGEKALMNDTSTLDAVKQFSAASMRTFRSLPDGRFLAFYPDYFGANRGPYWSVENIELTNFGIVLNDEQLATHVFVTGDTINFNNQIDLMEEIGTTGVATITQASMLNSFIEPWDPNADNSTLGKLFNAYSFLEHYGARPYKEEQPIIRNSAFEFLYAWQRFMQKWSQLFSTTVEMTFQPEVQAGGIIKFPDHHVQMFVESVTHTFDYEAGFSTSAVMSAPSIPKGTGKIAAERLPGFALAGSVNTVGVAGA